MDFSAPGILGLVPPFRIVAEGESVKVLDRRGVTAAYVYVCDDEERRQQTKRLTTAQGVETAKVIARALTAAVPDTAA
jgi:hypothetical protein